MQCLIYTGAFLKKEYAEMLFLLLKSYHDYGISNNFLKTNTVTFLIICSDDLMNDIIKIKRVLWRINILVWPVTISKNVHSFLQTLEACFYRYRIFQWEPIKNYDRILYLDTDILITNSISNILDINPENKIYVLSEGNTTQWIHGSELFDVNPKTSAFTSGIMLFNNCGDIKKLFDDIINDAMQKLKTNPKLVRGYDQPFTIYHAYKNNLYNNEELEDVAINNPKKFSGHTISHFPGPYVGKGNVKKVAMLTYLSKNSKLLSK